ncbi:hypothetical protein CFP56_016637 [Quercus suber]|uniref:Uncharacterized protein n=1 Tax=Quercus suber TaxID=58331 RepID=A0AAW0KPU1_QUESU
MNKEDHAMPLNCKAPGNPQPTHTGAQPRPSNGVEVREATSIHEAGGDRRRGFEAIGAGSTLGSEAIAARRRLGLSAQQRGITLLEKAAQK